MKTDQLETFLRDQAPESLVSVLLELAAEHEVVRARLARMQLTDQPDKLAASFKKILSGWRHSTRRIRYDEVHEFSLMLNGWLDQVARELMPSDPLAALALFEAFIESDEQWFERADDSGGGIGEVVRVACRYWLQAAARCQPQADEILGKDGDKTHVKSRGKPQRMVRNMAPPEDWSDRVQRLYEADRYGAREELLRNAGLLLDEVAQRVLVARFEWRLEQTLNSAPRANTLPVEVFEFSAALSLLAESLHDPDIKVRATLRYSPNPNSLQRKSFAQAFLDANRPADALAWLQSHGGLHDHWAQHEDSRQNMLAETLERLGRVEESSPIRQLIFERTPSEFYLQRWLKHLPEAAHAGAIAHARQVAMQHGDVIAAATLLVQLGDSSAAQARLLAEHHRIDGNFYDSLIPLAKSLRDNHCLRGEAVIYRALLKGILDRAYAKAYGHAARYWRRLGEIAASRADLSPLTSHRDFEALVRLQHGRKLAFWAYVNGSRRDRHDEAL